MTLPPSSPNEITTRMAMSGLVPKMTIPEKQAT